MCVCAGTSGEVTFFNLLSGEHRVRVTAGVQDAVIRSRVIVPDSPDFCSLNAINRGVTKNLDLNGAVANNTLEWRPIGVDAGFLCTVRGSGVTEKCNLVIATCSQVYIAMWGLKAHCVTVSVAIYMHR